MCSLNSFIFILKAMHKKGKSNEKENDFTVIPPDLML